MGVTAVTGDHDPTSSHYDIRMSGEIDEHWVGWFDGSALRRHGDGTTTIELPSADQAALHGALRRVRDLGVDLISVIRIEDPRPVTPAIPPGPAHKREENPR